MFSSTSLRAGALLAGIATAIILGSAAGGPQTDQSPGPAQMFQHWEVASDPPAASGPRVTAPPAYVERNGFVSVQVNVDEFGNNILNDAATEPTIATDPTDPYHLVIGWRQFESRDSRFPEAGYAYSHDGGRSWMSPGVLGSGSDPALDVDALGNFHYLSEVNLYISRDAGVTWEPAASVLAGAFKPWMAIDRTDGIGRGNIYVGGLFGFSRSVDGGRKFRGFDGAGLDFGTLVVGPDGALYAAGISFAGFRVLRSDSVQDPTLVPAFEHSVEVPLGRVVFFQPGGGDGWSGQYWIAVDRSGTTTHGNVYVLASVIRSGRLDVMFSRSEDRAETWSPRIRVNDDPNDSRAQQWFGAMSVAPNGRIDAAWLDTRETPGFSALYYSCSTDGGRTWSENVPVSPLFDHRIHDPSEKLGDYMHINSDEAGVNVAYPATFNGEPDIWYVRIGIRDCNGNGVDDAEDISSHTSRDKLPRGGDGIPDDCQSDCNHNRVPDDMDVIRGGMQDCNHNRVPDECEIAAGDCDGDGVLDECEPPTAPPGYALELPGEAAAVHVPHSTELQFAAGDEITLEAWIRRTSDRGLRAIVGKGFKSRWSYLLNLVGDTLVFRYRDATDTQTFRYRTDEGVIPPETWTHVAVTHTFAGDHTLLYVNGYPVPASANNDPPDTGPAAGESLLTIGAEITSDGVLERVFSGLIDEVRVWRVLRTQRQIRDNMRVDVRDQPGLVGYWRFDEGAGDVAADSAGDNDGTILNAEWQVVRTLAGDVDLDSDVDLQDLMQLLAAFRTCAGDPAFDPRADFNEDGCVTAEDLVAVVHNFGRVCP